MKHSAPRPHPPIQLTREQARALLGTFGSAWLTPTESTAVIDRMVEHGECLAHATAMVLEMPCRGFCCRPR